MSIFVAALDLGQVQDYTALVILEAKGTAATANYLVPNSLINMHVPATARFELPPIVQMDIRHIERFPLGTKYSEIARQVEARVRMTPNPTYFVIDKTGVGIPVIEYFLHLRPHGITITGGNQATCPAPCDYHVPKRDLVSALQVPLQNGTCRIARSLPQAKLLEKEMLAFRAKISVGGHDTYEAWRENEHDDLVLAASMAAWMAEEAYRWRAHEAREALEAAILQAQGEYTISPV